MFFSPLPPQGKEKRERERVLGELRLKLETSWAFAVHWLSLNPWIWNLAVSVIHQKV